MVINQQSIGVASQSFGFSGVDGVLGLGRYGSAPCPYTYGTAFPGRRADAGEILVTGLPPASDCHAPITNVGSSGSDRVVVTRRRVASAGHRLIAAGRPHGRPR